MFPGARFVAVEKTFAIADNISRETVTGKYPSMGGSIKAVEITESYPAFKKSNTVCAIDYLTAIGSTSKLSFAVAEYPKKSRHAQGTGP